MTHLGYIAAAYGASALVLGGMTAFILGDLRAKRRELERLGGPRNGGAISRAVTPGLDLGDQASGSPGPRVALRLPEDDHRNAAGSSGPTA